MGHTPAEAAVSLGLSHTPLWKVQRLVYVRPSLPQM